MGYIPSGTSSSMTIYFTQKGIEYILGKRNSPEDLVIRYFTLGDSDVNYKITNSLANGYVPDIAGLSGTSITITGVNEVKWKISQ